MFDCFMFDSCHISVPATSGNFFFCDVQVSQGEIHLIQQEGGLAFSVEGEVSPSDGGEQVVTNLDMLSFEMQSLEPAPAKQKPFKVYR